MKILILGASSYVGARLYVDLVKEFDVIGTYASNQLSSQFIHLDIVNSNEVAVVIDRIKPNVIVHAANNANGRWCEANPEDAIELNQESTVAIIDAANKVGAKLIYISSYAAIKPSNVYGNTKYTSEELIKNTCTSWVILRPSLIVGYSPNTINDRPFNRILKNLDERTEAIYDTSWKFQPTWLGHISKAISEVVKLNISNVTIPLACEDLKSRYDLALDILTPFGFTVTSLNANDDSDVFEENLSELTRHNMTQCSYGSMIKNIVDEIKHRENYSFKPR